MPKNLLFIFMIFHFIVEDYIACDALWHNHMGYVVIRLGVRLITMLGFALYIASFQIAMIGLWLAVFSFMLDCIQCLNWKHYKQHLLYCTMQLLKVVLIVGLFYLLPIQDIDALNDKFMLLLTGVIVALPIAHWLGALLWRYRLQLENGYSDINFWIGILERLLILCMLVVRQFFGIGVLFLLKSLIQYRRIYQEKGFAEYYLLETMLSFFLTFMIYIYSILFSLFQNMNRVIK